MLRGRASLRAGLASLPSRCLRDRRGPRAVMSSRIVAGALSLALLAAAPVASVVVVAGAER